MRFERGYRRAAEELRNFARGQRGEGHALLTTAAAMLEREAEGGWVPYRRIAGGCHQHDLRFLVYDRRRGIQIASRDNVDGYWTTETGEVLEQVTHWRYLPVAPQSGDQPNTHSTA